MDEGRDDHAGWIADGLAAGILGAAVGTCLLWLGHAQWGVLSGSSTVLAALIVLRSVSPEPRRFKLPTFEAAAVPAEVPEVLELTERWQPVVATLLEPASEPLILEDRLDEPDPDSRVVQLFAARPLPTPGELRDRIEAHLAPRQTDTPRPPLREVDASAALREALGELRRSLA